MSIEKIETYRTSDGKLHEELSVATTHEAKLDIRRQLQEHRLYGNYEGSYVEANALCEWLCKNRRMVLNYYGVVEQAP